MKKRSPEELRSVRVADMTPDERWEAFGHEVLAAFLQDDVLDYEEAYLLNRLWELYDLDFSVPYVDSPSGSGFWSDLRRFANSAPRSDEDPALATAEAGAIIVRRFILDGPVEHSTFTSFATWATGVGRGRGRGGGRGRCRGDEGNRLADFWRSAGAAIRRAGSTPVHPTPTSPQPPFSGGSPRVEHTPAGTYAPVRGASPPPAHREDLRRTPPAPPPEDSPRRPEPAAPAAPATSAPPPRPRRPASLPAPVRWTAPHPERIRARVAAQLAPPSPEDARSFAAWAEDPVRALGSVAAFEQLRLPEAPAICHAPELPLTDEVWFAGDVHGDLLGLELVLDAFTTCASAGARLVFLGDLIDDGPHSLRVIQRVVSAMRQQPGRVAWLAGNHDLGLGYSVDAGRFTSTVQPRECAEALNRALDRGEDHFATFGRAAVELIGALPRALFLPGLLAAHGGFPHNDTWDGLHTLAALSEPRCLDDFAWNRWSDARFKRPNRGSHQSTFGADDFFGFAAAVRPLGLNVHAMVRGHDHVTGQAERWERKEEVPRSSYDGRILTINTLSHTQRRETHPATIPGRRLVTVARWRACEELPVPVVLEVPDSLAEWYAPVCPVCHLPGPPETDACVTRRGDSRCEGRYPVALRDGPTDESPGRTAPTADVLFTTSGADTPGRPGTE